MMKSKRAEEFIRNSAFSAIQLPGEVMYSIHMNVEGKLLDRKSAERAVELAEQDAEEEVNHYRKELEESKRREELARKVIDDQRKKIEMLKARAVCAFDSLDFTELMTAECVQDFDNVKCRLRGLFLQILNER